MMGKVDIITKEEGSGSESEVPTPADISVKNLREIGLFIAGLFPLISGGAGT